MLRKFTTWAKLSQEAASLDELSRLVHFGVHSKKFCAVLKNFGASGCVGCRNCTFESSVLSAVKPRDSHRRCRPIHASNCILGLSIILNHGSTPVWASLLAVRGTEMFSLSFFHRSRIIFSRWNRMSYRMSSNNLLNFLGCWRLREGREFSSLLLIENNPHSHRHEASSSKSFVYRCETPSSTSFVVYFASRLQGNMFAIITTVSIITDWLWRHVLVMPCTLCDFRKHLSVLV